MQLKQSVRAHPWAIGLEILGHCRFFEDTPFGGGASRKLSLKFFPVAVARKSVWMCFGEEGGDDMMEFATLI